MYILFKDQNVQALKFTSHKPFLKRIPDKSFVKPQWGPREYDTPVAEFAILFGGYQIFFLPIG